ncbi:efflux RND transporter permease subunit [Arsenicibacter rosenii]|uniref:SSD domain-containing protein n=1 Tax=Arsenicibacter rosenii TaxID=1750698 RepID=A0A1S2VCY3_9BACT|nr:MMPL family transporter [Arsenicibacter rosenii]OIN56627.1 hypothetical protein BLX24_23640 [Arsenicibacter rosenii]
MIHHLYHLRYYLLLLTLVCCVWLWPGIRSAVQVDNSLTVWFQQDDPALVRYQQFQERFGNDEVVIATVTAPESLLTPAHLHTLIRLTSALETLPDVDQVIGPGNMQIPVKGALGIDSEPLLTDTTSAATLTARLRYRPTLRQQLFNEDYTTARLLIVLKKIPDFDTRRGRILTGIQQTARRYIGSEQWHVGGIGIIYTGLNTLSQQDFGFFLGVGYLFMLALFRWIYKRPVLILYAVGIITCSTYLTLGLYGTLGYRLNLMTVLLPIIIVLPGVMDAIHVINERNQLATPRQTAKESALAALTHVFRPCLFTVCTTATGFLTLLTSPMAILQTFGVFAALGIVLCFVFTYLLGVILLPLSPPAREHTVVTGQLLSRLLFFVSTHKNAFLSLSAVLILVFGAGISRLRIDTYTLGYFPANHPVVTDHVAMQKNWGPYIPLELLVEPKAGYTLQSTQLVNAARIFADSAARIPGVGQIFGFFSLYQSGFEGLYGQKGVRYLRSQSAVNEVHRRLRLQYPALARTFIHDSTQTGRITVSGAMMSARMLTGKMDTLMQLANRTIGPYATVNASGYQPMYAGIVQYVTSSQANSLLLSFVTIFVLVWLFIRDFRLAALTVIPNLFPVLVMMGLMGWTGITLDTATASIGAIVLSFCVDDSIHFIYTYKTCRQQNNCPERARMTTITHIGPAIVQTAAVLFAGFALMMFGSLKTVQYWGILTTVAIIGALYGELIIFPLILERFDRR